MHRSHHGSRPCFFSICRVFRRRRCLSEVFSILIRHPPTSSGALMIPLLLNVPIPFYLAYNLVVAVSGMAATGRFQYSPIGFGRGVFFYRFIRGKGWILCRWASLLLAEGIASGRYAPEVFLAFLRSGYRFFRDSRQQHYDCFLGYVIIASHYVTGDIIASCPSSGHVEQAMVVVMPVPVCNSCSMFISAWCPPP